MIYQSIVIVGLGMMGGSLAKHIYHNHPSIKLIGIDPNTNNQHDAKYSDIFESVFSSISECPKQVDCVFVCTPISTVKKCIEALDAHIQSPVVISDIASVKSLFSSISLTHKDHLYIPGHPMTGKASSGFEHSEGEIFQKAPYILIPQQHQSYNNFVEFIDSLGCEIVEMTAKQHDYFIALASHTPYFISASCVSITQNLTEEELSLFKKIVGPGFSDTTRIAASNLDWAIDIAKHNSDNIMNSIDTCIDSLQLLKKMIQEGNDKKLHELLNDFKTLKLNS